MLSTIWTCTQEWSDIPSRSEATWAMCHQARSSRSGVDPLQQRLEPPVATRRRADARLGDGRRRVHASLVGSRGALGSVGVHAPSVSGHAAEPER